MLPQIQSYARARASLRQIFIQNGILINDNHVGTIGELYAKVFIESFGLSVRSAIKVNSPYDLVDSLEIKYSVKTITAENTSGTTSPVNITENWTVLIAVNLDNDFMLEKMALITKNQLVTYPVFVNNICRRNAGSKSHPRFQWWDFLDHYLV